MRGEGRRREATLLIQATYRMYRCLPFLPFLHDCPPRQKRWWGKLRQGVVALQKLARRRKGRGQQEERKWLDELEEVAGRRAGLERRYRRLLRLPPSQVGGFLLREREVAATRIQRWWRGLRPQEGSTEEDREGGRRDRAACIIQVAARRWLEARHQSPAWSKLLQPRQMTEARARSLRREVEVWQARHGPEHLDWSPELHTRCQERYARLLAGTGARYLPSSCPPPYPPSRRLAEHRTSLASARASACLAVLEAAPALEEYSEDMWSTVSSSPGPNPLPSTTSCPWPRLRRPGWSTGEPWRDCRCRAGRGGCWRRPKGQSRLLSPLSREDSSDN